MIIQWKVTEIYASCDKVTIEVCREMVKNNLLIPINIPFSI